MEKRFLPKESKERIYCKPFPGVFVCTSSAKTPSFVELFTKEDWVIIGIGECYSGGSFAKKIFSLLDGNLGVAFTTDKLFEELVKLPGQYCGVLYNKKSGDLIKVSDPSGSRSLFYGEVDGVKISASSLSMFRAMTDSKSVKPNIENQKFLLRYAYSMPGKCAYENVVEVLPGRIEAGNIYTDKLTVNDSFDCGKAAYKDNLSRQNLKISHNENELALFNCLKEVCAQQLGSSKKVGVLLGGFDSALVASILHHLGAQVHTYSFFYDNHSYNQPFTELLAKTHGISHHWVEINSNVIKEGLKTFGVNCSWPTMWLNYVVQTQYVCRKMSRDGMESCFSGDGCDTAFLGYPSTHRRGQVYQRIPEISEKLSKSLVSLIHYSKLEYYFGHIVRVALSLLDAAKESIDKRPLYSFQLFNSSSYRNLTGKEYDYSALHNKYFLNLQSKIEGLSYERKIYLAKSFISPNRAKMVSSSDVSGLCIHSPYLHSALKSFANNLPEEVLRPDNNALGKEGKFLLMKMAENYGLLPHEIIYQSKIAAIKSPIDDWLANDLFDFSENKLSALPFEYDSGYVKTLLRNLLPEKVYKKYFSSDDVVSLAPSLLLTYASLFE